MSAIATAVELPDPAFHMDMETGDAKVAAARRLTELALRGEADLSEIAAALNLWLEIDEAMRDPKNLQRNEQAGPFNEYADEWPCTHVEPVDD